MAKQKRKSFLPEGFEKECSRRQGSRPKRRNILIVCEGEKTEPNYFEAFRKTLVGGEGDRVEVVGIGENTLNLVEKAKKIVEERSRSEKPPFYYVWLVFDKDDFPNEHFDNAINLIAQENQKFCSGKTPHWYAAWSNEAFELWYILHFQEALGGALPRTSMCTLLSNYFREYLTINDGYKKNDPHLFSLLRPFMNVAIQRAERSFTQWENTLPHKCNPATRVFELVKLLRDYS